MRIPDYAFELASLDFAGLLYARRSDSCERDLSKDTRSFMKLLGMRMLSSGCYRQVYRVPKASVVIKINYRFDSFDWHLNAKEAETFQEFMHKFTKESKVRLATTALVSPNVSVQEFVKGTSDCDDENKAHNWMARAGLPTNDVHAGNFRFVKGKLVVIDF